jgi:hypothetical protein
MKRNPERFEKMANSLSAHNAYHIACGLMRKQPDEFSVKRLDREIEKAKQ